MTAPMDPRVLWRLGVCVFLLSATPGAAEDLPAGFRMDRSGPFEIIGADPKALALAGELAAACVQSAPMLADEAPDRDAPPICIEIATPAEALIVPAKPRLIDARDGSIRLILPWDSSVRLESLCRAVAEAYLRSSARAAPCGRSAFDWWPQAVAVETADLLQPGRAVEAALRVRRESLAPAEFFLEQLESDGAGRTPSSAQAYFFRRFLKDLIPDEEHRRRFIFHATPREQRDTLERALRKSPWNGAPIEPAWATWVEAEVRSQTGPVLAMQDSRLLFLDFGEFLGREALTGRRGIFSLRSLWPARRDPAVREWLKRRIRRLKLRLPQVNPVYFNAVHSLGSAMEAILEADREEFLLALEKSAIDWDQAREVERAIRKAPVQKP